MHYYKIKSQLRLHYFYYCIKFLEQILEDFEKLVKRNMECDLEEKIDKNNEKAIDDIDNINIFLDIVR